MQRALIRLRSGRDVEAACRLIRQAPAGSRVEVNGPQRTIDQNAKMWAMLTDIARQRPGGRIYTPDEWKVMFLHAVGKELKLLPALEGRGFVPYGSSSSRLSVGEMIDLIEFMQAWAIENGVTLQGDPDGSA